MGPAFIEIKVEEVAAIFVGGLVSLAADTFITPLLGNNGFMPNFFIYPARALRALGLLLYSRNGEDFLTGQLNFLRKQL